MNAGVVEARIASRRQSRINTICAVAALVYALIAIAFATTTANLGFTMLHSGSPIFGVDDADTGLRSGDRVLAIDGVRTDTRESRELAFSRLDDKETVTLEVARGSEHLTLTVPAKPGLPIDAVAGIVLAFLLLAISFVVRYTLFQRLTALYVVTMAGTMLLPVVERVAPLHLVHITCATLAAPATCHHMLVFPLGRKLSRRVLAALYAPSLVLIGAMSIDAITGVFSVSMRQSVIGCWMAWATLLLVIGSIVRRRDIKRHGHRIDVTLVRWIYACSAVIVAGMSAAVAWVIHHPESFVGGGFRPIIAVTMAGGSGCIMMALARHEIGAHVRTLQRGASVLLVAGIATALLIPILIALGAARNVVDGGQLVVAAIGIAGIAMALVGARLQRAFDARDAAVRDRAARQSAQDLDAAQSKVASLEQHLADLQKRIEDSRPPGLRRPSRPLIGDGLRGTYELVDRVAPADTTVLIVGETGVGKEVIAKAIHSASTRSQRPFVAIDCFAAENHLFEDEIRKAHTGTVFLDEVCDLSLDLQGKLARIIETPEALDTRIIAGTNRDLERMVADGMFRAELFYRLRVFEIAVPPLRARRQDIAPLAVSFLAAAGARARSLTPEALEVLHAHHWPGNVRELRHVIEAAALVCDGDALRATDLRIDRDVFRSKAREALSKSGPDTGLRETLSTLERERLERALAEHQGNQSAAAKALGMSRPALRRRLARYAIQGQASPKR